MEKWKLDTLGKTGGKKGVTIQKVPHTFATQSVQLTFEAGAVLPLHTTPVDVLFYVIEGTGIVTIGEEKQECPAGTYIESPGNIPHGWENQSKEHFKVLVIKLFN